MSSPGTRSKYSVVYGTHSPGSDVGSVAWLLLEETTPESGVSTA